MPYASNNLKPAEAFRLLNIPDHAAAALLRTITEIQKLNMDMGIGRDEQPVYVVPGFYTDLPSTFRTRLIAETLDYGSDTFGGLGRIPASSFCAICAEPDLLNLPGFDIPHLRHLSQTMNRLTRFDAEEAINEAQSILSSLDAIATAQCESLAAFEFAALMPRERFVYLIQKQDDLRDFLDLVDNFPEMLFEDNTKQVYRRTIAPLYYFELGDDKLARDITDMLDKIKTGMIANGPKADIIPFRKPKPHFIAP